MPPTTSRADFEALIRRAGLSLTPEQVAELYVGWAHVEPMLARGRAPGRGRAPPPARALRPPPPSPR